MNWADERYVRLYTSETGDWSMWPWQSRATFPLLLRRASRTGVVPLGKFGLQGVAALVGLPFEVFGPGIEGLLLDGCVEQRGGDLVFRNFVQAQETTASDAKRARDYRERLKSLPSRSVSPPSQESDESTRGVTDNHGASESSPCSGPSVLSGPSVPKEPPAAVASVGLLPKVADDRPTAAPVLALVSPPSAKPPKAARPRDAGMDALIAIYERAYGAPPGHAWTAGEATQLAASRKRWDDATICRAFEALAADPFNLKQPLHALLAPGKVEIGLRTAKAPAPVSRFPDHDANRPKPQPFVPRPLESPEQREAGKKIRDALLAQAQTEATNVSR